jgi:phage terminase large subunit-like protein
MKNVEYKALAAEGSTAHGLSPVVAILDEIGQVKGSSSAFIEAITTSQGAHDAPLLIAISTSAPSDADLWSMWIDDAVKSEDKNTVVHEYKADENSDLLDEEQWLKANPAMGIFRNKDDLDTQLNQASRLPALEANARNLLLNQRVAQEALFLAPAIWKKNNGDIDIEVFRNNSVSIGLDLSARNDLTAAVAAAMDQDGVVHLMPWVFCPSNGIEERARRDRAPYDMWVKQGKMIALGGSSMDYEHVASYMRDALDDLDIVPTSIEFDRWRIDVFKKASDDVAFAPWAEWNNVGQGFKDFAPRVEAFESLLLEGKIKHGNHPLLNMAAANAIAVADPSGSRKIDKSKATQRIDPLIAAVMATFAVSEGNVTQTFDVSALIG